MTKQYTDLFKEIARTASVLAEQVIDYNQKNNVGEDESKAAFTMRDDYARLYDNMQNADYIITWQDYIKLLAASMIVTNNLADKIIMEQKALSRYQTNLLPKLQRIMNECKSNEEADKLANELFTIPESE